MKKIFLLSSILLLASLTLTGCGEKKETPEDAVAEWRKTANLSDHLTKEELYDAALSEDTLVVYSISSRAFDVKDAFEKEYPGLSVEVKDIRSNDVVDMLKKNYEAKKFDCDVVILSDCDGSLYMELFNPGIIKTYIPWDIAPKLKKSSPDEELDFVYEAMIFFYNSRIFEAQPISNIWELTEDRFKGKIMMPSPLSSFSTYGFCAQILSEDEALAKAYFEYKNEPLSVPEDKTTGVVFLEMLGGNIRFVNSNDEVLEGVGNSEDAWIAAMVSSKYRYHTLGYEFAPITGISPFSGVYTPNSIELVSGAENINTAKLFIRFVLGETDGTGEGIAPFSSEGTWSARTDVKDGNTIPIKENEILEINKSLLYENRENYTEFFGKLLEKNISSGGEE